jgi:mono/diheme cytochrome c family protein
MKPWCIGVSAVLVVVLALAGVAATLFARGGISARTEPSALEARVARNLRGLAIPADAKSAKNPLPSTPEVLSEGRAHFADHCASCHANDGSGDTQLGRRMYPRAPDLRKPETQRLTDGEIFYIIENGVRLTGMPGWGGEGHEEASWGLVHFIRHLPELTPEEEAEMERLNPRTAEEWRELQEDDAFLGGGDGGDGGPSHAHH